MTVSLAVEQTGAAPDARHPAWGVGTFGNRVSPPALVRRGGAQAQTFHGARPSAQSASSARFSRSVSTGCQKPAWR